MVQQLLRGRSLVTGDSTSYIIIAIVGGVCSILLFFRKLLYKSDANIPEVDGEGIEMPDDITDITGWAKKMAYKQGKKKLKEMMQKKGEKKSESTEKITTHSNPMLDTTSVSSSSLSSSLSTSKGPTGPAPWKDKLIASRLQFAIAPLEKILGIDCLDDLEHIVPEDIAELGLPKVKARKLQALLIKPWKSKLRAANLESAIGPLHEMFGVDCLQDFAELEVDEVDELTSVNKEVRTRLKDFIKGFENNGGVKVKGLEKKGKSGVSIRV